MKTKAIDIRAYRELEIMKEQTGRTFKHLMDEGLSLLYDRLITNTDLHIPSVILQEVPGETRRYNRIHFSGEMEDIFVEIKEKTGVTNHSITAACVAELRAKTSSQVLA